MVSVSIGICRKLILIIQQVILVLFKTISKVIKSIHVSTFCLKCVCLKIIYREGLFFWHIIKIKQTVTIGFRNIWWRTCLNFCNWNIIIACWLTKRIKIKISEGIIINWLFWRSIGGKILKIGKWIVRFFLKSMSIIWWFKLIMLS